MTPGRIGPLQLANRIVLPAMDMNHCEDGVITDDEIAHYRARAQGGTAMIITGSGAVAFPHGAASRKQPGLSDDRFIPGLARLAEAVHGAGSLLCIQLCHHAKAARVDIAEDRPVLVPSAPVGHDDMSALRDNTAEEIALLAATTGGKLPSYREADEDDLAWVIDEFAAAARRARNAGADAVEIHAAHGYLLSMFLAAADNRRTDRWGGPIENRARLTVEVIGAVRAAVDPEMAVMVRVSGREFGEAGALTTEEAAAAARLFAAAGADAIHVTGYGRNSFANFTDGPLPDAVGAYRSYARAVREALEVPVIAVGRIVPELAEEMIGAGDCDFVSMGRQLLTDPDIVAKLRGGRRASIRPCINCYVCVEQNFFDAAPRCAVNPALGAEELAAPRPASPPRHVVAVGGGPGGMEAARIAAERGHRVTLVEAADRLGGTAWFSQLTTPANGPFVEWQARELGRVGVAVVLGTKASVESVAALRPDAVVVATGAARGRPAVPGATLPHVHTGDDLRALLAGGPAGQQPRRTRALLRMGRVLRITTDPDRVRRLSRRWMPIGRRVVVVGGGLVGLELAEFLAARRRTVTLLEPGPHLGLPMASPRRWTAVRHAAEQGVTVVRGATVVEITTVDVAYVVDGERRRAGADDVVIAGEVESGAPLAEGLRERGFEVHVIGDAGEVGYIEGAVRSAWNVAAAL